MTSLVMLVQFAAVLTATILFLICVVAFVSRHVGQAFNLPRKRKQG